LMRTYSLEQVKTNQKNLFACKLQGSQSKSVTCMLKNPTFKGDYFVSLQTLIWPECGRVRRIL
jgi:hypothetical protein